MLEKALRAIMALVDQDFTNPVLDSFRDVIEADASNGAEGIAVDCRAIAEKVLTSRFSDGTLVNLR